MDAALIALIGGFITALIGAAIKLVQMTVAAERRRADDWRTTAQTSAETTKVLSASVNKLIVSVEQLTSSQRDMMTLLETSQRELLTAQREVMTLLRTMNSPRGGGG